MNIKDKEELQDMLFLWDTDKEITSVSMYKEGEVYVQMLGMEMLRLLLNERPTIQDLSPSELLMYEDAALDAYTTKYGGSELSSTVKNQAFNLGRVFYRHGYSAAMEMARDRHITVKRLPPRQKKET
jgi:hypothetical protein